MKSCTGASLAGVLGPLSETDFFEQYWERMPVHLSRDKESHFAPLLTVDDIELFLSTQNPVFPSVQLTHSAKPANPSEYTDESSHIIAKKLFERHHEGATIVISQAHDSFTKLANFKAEIQSELLLRCQTNVYLSPPSEQGFNPHYDSHDVFILQVAGSKTFNIYGGGVELPFSHEPFDAAFHECGALQESIVLQAGDTLYIPRGVMHDAVSSDSSSLHITLGVYPITVYDAMLEMLQRQGELDARYRQSVPRSNLRGSDQLPLENSEISKVMLNPGFSPELLRQSVSNLLDNVAIAAAPDLSGALSKPAQVNSISDNSEVQLRSNTIISVEYLESAVRCRTRGQILEFNNEMKEAVVQLLEGLWLRVDQLRLSDKHARLAICNELVKAGLLNVR